MESRQRRQKARIKDFLKEEMSNAKSVIFADFRGVSVADDTKLRRQCRENDVTYRNQEFPGAKGRPRTQLGRLGRYIQRAHRHGFKHDGSRGPRQSAA